MKYHFHRNRLVWLSLFLLFSINIFSQNFIEQEIRIKTNGGYLYGTYCYPKGKAETPLALIIAGSGPTDRNGNNPLAGENNSLKMLAEQLAEHQIASIRFDKRGVGKSASLLTDESKIDFNQMVMDAEAWLKWMKKQKKHKGIWIIGHSEGSLVGMLTARHMQTDGFISLSGPGQRASNMLRTQLAQQPEMIRDESYRLLDSLERGVRVAEVNPLLNTLFRPSVQPYLISWFAYDPCEEIRKLSSPVLIIQGDADIQVKVWDGERLALCNLNAKLAVIENMNHILKTLEQKDNLAANIASYADPLRPLSEKLVSEIVSFISKQN